MANEAYMVHALRSACASCNVAIFGATIFSAPRRLVCVFAVLKGTGGSEWSSASTPERSSETVSKMGRR